MILDSLCVTYFAPIKGLRKGSEDQFAESLSNKDRLRSNEVDATIYFVPCHRNVPDGICQN